MNDKIRVMLVDDNEALIETVSKYFSKKGGVEVIGVAHHSMEAIEILKDRSPDLIVLDIVMPKSDGFMLLRHLNENDGYKKLDVIVLSSLNNDVVIQETVKLGASYFITKPFKLDMLYNRVLEIYEQNKLIKQFIYPLDADQGHLPGTDI